MCGTKQLIHYGERIIFEREQFIEELNHIILIYIRILRGEKEILNISYEPNVSSENFAALLKENREKDLKFKLTSTRAS